MSNALTESDMPSECDELDVVNADSLIEKICVETDIPALGDSISEIVQLSSSDEASMQKLADLIISDVALTKKILNLSNSAVFRSSTSQEVTSITVAIQLLGLDTVKTCALAVILIDAISGKQAQYVRIELSRALMASVASRELAKTSHFKNAEEVTIVALFKNIGRLLIAAYDPKLYKEIMAQIREGRHSANQASLQVLGFSFDTLAEHAMKSWQIPDSIIKAMKFMPAKVLPQPKTRLEWMQQAAAFSESIATHIFEKDEAEEQASADNLVKCFGKTFNVSHEKLGNLIECATEAGSLFGQNNLCASRGFADADHMRYPSGKPFDAHERLAEGVKGVETLISGSYEFNALIQLVVKTIHTSLGTRFATLCLRDAKTNQYQARSSLGDNSANYQKNFVFPAAQTNDLFNLAMRNNIDLLISDTSVEKVRKLIPRWHARLLPDTRSLIILPLVIDGNPIGLFYFDSKEAAPEGVSSEEMKLLRSLKNQVLTILSSK